MMKTTSIPGPQPLSPQVSDLAAHLDAQVLIRSAVIAVLLGSILTVLNQSDAVLADARFEFLPLLQVYVTPFLVVSLSQVLGRRQAQLDAREDPGLERARESFLATAMSHGIARRSAALGLAAGSANTMIAISTSLLFGAGVAALPGALLAQSFVLPAVFGLLSQTLAYRRAAAQRSPR